MYDEIHHFLIVDVSSNATISFTAVEYDDITSVIDTIEVSKEYPFSWYGQYENYSCHCDSEDRGKNIGKVVGTVICVLVVGILAIVIAIVIARGRGKWGPEKKEETVELSENAF